MVLTVGENKYRVVTHGIRFKLYKTEDYANSTEEVEVMRNASISQIAKEIAEEEGLDCEDLQNDLKDML